jgi:hypothetical protein
VERIEYDAGPDQVIVLFVTEDYGEPLDPGEIFQAVADEARNRSTAGWRIVSVSTMPVRQMGTAGNIFFQSGGQFASKAAVAVVFGRTSGAG